MLNRQINILALIPTRAGRLALKIFSKLFFCFELYLHMNTETKIMKEALTDMLRVRIPKEMAKDLEELRKQSSINVSCLIRNYLSTYISRNKISEKRLILKKGEY